MRYEIKLADIRRLADHYRAIGITEHHLGWIKEDSEIDSVPWHLALSCEEGGSHRMDIATDVRFSAYDPQTGFSLRWSWELESRDASGKGHYQINAAGAKEVMKRLPDVHARESFSAYLRKCAKAVRAKAKEWEGYATKQYADAETLESILR